MRAAQRIVLVVTVAVVLGACGSDGAQEATTSTTTAQTTIAPVETTVPPTSEAPTTLAASTVAPTTVAPTTVAPTTAASTTVPPTTAASSGCTAGDAALKTVLAAYAHGAQPAAVVTVSGITHAPSDPSWARGVVTPKDPSLDGFTAIAHCVGFTWTVVDAGTSGVGCAAPVPPAVQASIGLEC